MEVGHVFSASLAGE